MAGVGSEAGEELLCICTLSMMEESVSVPFVISDSFETSTHRCKNCGTFCSFQAVLDLTTFSSRQALNSADWSVPPNAAASMSQTNC
jgi:hypothetical protein